MKKYGSFLVCAALLLACLGLLAAWRESLRSAADLNAEVRRMQAALQETRMAETEDPIAAFSTPFPTPAGPSGFSPFWKRRRTSAKPAAPPSCWKKPGRTPRFWTPSWNSPRHRHSPLLTSGPKVWKHRGPVPQGPGRIRRRPGFPFTALPLSA